MTISSDAVPSATFAARCFKVSRVIHWITVALPISGWFLASEEGTSAHLLGIPALPQWYFQEAAQQSTAIRAASPSETTPSDTPVVVNLIRIHAALAAALFLVAALHIFTVIRVRARRDSHASGV